MAFPTTPSLASEYEEIKRNAADIKRKCAAASAAMATGPYNSTYMKELLDRLKVVDARFAGYSKNGALVAYAKQMENDESLDLQQEFRDMRAAIQAAGKWIIDNYPKDEGGYILDVSMDAQGNRAERTFSAAATTDLRPLLDAIVASIG